MTHGTARTIVRDRIAALVPSSGYAASSFALGDVTAWVEAPYPLVPELAPVPGMLAPLAFFVDNRTIIAKESRRGFDPLFVRAPATIRFLYPMRSAGPEIDDWDRATLALEALIDHLLDPTWSESAGDGGLIVTWDAGQSATIQPIHLGEGADWLLVSLSIMLQYERTT